jgi:hypothetical protein
VMIVDLNGLHRDWNCEGVCGTSFTFLDGQKYFGHYIHSDYTVDNPALYYIYTVNAGLPLTGDYLETTMHATFIKTFKFENDNGNLKISSTADDSWTKTTAFKFNGNADNSFTVADFVDHYEFYLNGEEIYNKTHPCYFQSGTPPYGCENPGTGDFYPENFNINFGGTVTTSPTVSDVIFDDDTIMFKNVANAYGCIVPLSFNIPAELEYYWCMFKAFITQSWKNGISMLTTGLSALFTTLFVPTNVNGASFNSQIATVSASMKAKAPLAYVILPLQYLQSMDLTAEPDYAPIVIPIGLPEGTLGTSGLHQDISLDLRPPADVQSFITNTEKPIMRYIVDFAFILIWVRYTLLFFNIKLPHGGGTDDTVEYNEWQNTHH